MDHAGLLLLQLFLFPLLSSGYTLPRGHGLLVPTVMSAVAALVTRPFLLLSWLTTAAVVVLDVAKRPQNVLRHVDHGHEVRIALRLLNSTVAEVRLAPHIELVPLILDAIDKVFRGAVNLQFATQGKGLETCN